MLWSTLSMALRELRRNTMRSVLTTLGIIIGVGAVIALVDVYKRQAVTRGDLRVSITATGTLQATTTVEVGAEVSGRILKMTVDAASAGDEAGVNNVGFWGIALRPHTTYNLSLIHI